MQQRPVWFHRRSDLQIFSALDGITPPDLAEAAAKPGVAEETINLQRCIEMGRSFSDMILGARKISGERRRLRVSGTQGASSLQRIGRFTDPTKTKLKFRHADPRKSKAGCLRSSGLSRSQCAFQVASRLTIV